MHTIPVLVFTHLASAAVAFAFRGWISRTKIAIGQHILDAVKSGDAAAQKILTSVTAKL